LRPFRSIAAVLAALAAILGFSLWGALQEQGRLTDDFAAATRQQLHASVEALSARLDALDQDTRMLSDLVERASSEGELGRSNDRRVWESAFRALAVVVAQYRAIALIAPDGTFEVLAADPSETPDTLDALAPPMRHLAGDVSATHTRALGQTVRHGARSFLLYGTPLHDGRSIVVASDAGIFLGAVAWSSVASARLFVTDPAGIVWSGCETARGCKVASAADQHPPLELTSREPRGAGRQTRAPRAFDDPSVQVSEKIDRPTGSWLVTWLASTRAIIDREQSTVFRVVLTAIAAALAVAVVAGVVLRQQRDAIALEGRLKHAQELWVLEQHLVRAEKLITVVVLSAGIAHEIGSPLAVIRGRAQQVLRAVGDGPRAEDLRVIIKHIDKISSTIGQILDFSRRQPIDRRAVPLDAIVDRALGLLQWKLEVKHVEIQLDFERGLPMLSADPDQLEQVLVNLLMNACDASADRDAVTVAARNAPEGTVRIEVADRGCGIAPEHMNAVLDPLFTTKKRGEGTGLGLPVAAGIVRNHGGEINLTSTLGKGTTVAVLWPAAARAHGRNGGAHA
jgi:signal transduction histidine kinase